MLTPTLEPPHAGLTTSGSGISTVLSASSFEISVPFGIGTPAGISTFLARDLSIEIAELKNPGPVYLIPRRSNVACILPFSPFSPWRPINTISAFSQ